MYGFSRKRRARLRKALGRRLVRKHSAMRQRRYRK